MRKINIKIITGMLLAGMLLSCTKKLDRYPYDSIELSQSFKTVEDAETWNNGLYSNLRARIYGTYTFTGDVQADQLNASLEFGNRNGSPHRWEGFQADNYTISDVWSGYYRAITNLNIAISGFKHIEPQGADETAKLDQYLGDAYLARAYYYHRLVLRWARPYEPGTAAADPGVPLVLTYDVYNRPPRASVQEVYDQILRDIAAAKARLSATAFSAVRTGRFNIDVVTALEARVKLDMHDWAGAKTAADALIIGGNYPLITTHAELAAMWKEDLEKEVIYQLKVSAPNELATANSIYLGLIPQTGKFTPDFIPSQWVVDMYEANDIRKPVYFEQKTLTIQGKDHPGIYLVNKYPGNPALFTGNTNYQHAPRVFRIAEMYLISAEAGARAGAGSEDAALTRLNQLREARGLHALNGLTGAALMQAIKDERFRELAFEGFRLDDLKRWHEGFQRRQPQNIATIQTGQYYQTLSVAADADKFTWGIPTNDISINANLKPQNPGW